MERAGDTDEQHSRAEIPQQDHDGRIQLVKQRQGRRRDRAMARLPVNVVAVGRSGPAYRSMTSIVSDNGRLVSTNVAKH